MKPCSLLPLTLFSVLASGCASNVSDSHWGQGEEALGAATCEGPEGRARCLADNQQSEVVESAQGLSAAKPLPSACLAGGVSSMRIAEGRHFNDEQLRASRMLTTLGYTRACGVSLEVMFPSSESCGHADYQGTSTHWNKLYGVGQFGGGLFNRYQYSSVRLGWRYRPEKDVFELSPYLHDGCNTANGCGIYLENPQNHIQSDNGSLEPVQVQPNAWVAVDMEYRGDSYTARIGERTFKGSMAKKTRFPSVLLDMAYFGGQPTAPSDLHLLMRNVQVRKTCR